MTPCYACSVLWWTTYKNISHFFRYTKFSWNEIKILKISVILQLSVFVLLAIIDKFTVINQIWMRSWLIDTLNSVSLFSIPEIHFILFSFLDFRLQPFPEYFTQGSLSMENPNCRWKSLFACMLILWKSKAMTLNGLGICAFTNSILLGIELVFLWHSIGQIPWP